MSVMKMLRADIPYDELDLEDPKVTKAINNLAKEVKYNSYLYEFLEVAYPWQQQVAEYTKDHTVIGTIAANRVGKSEIGCAILTCHLTGIYPDWWKGKKYDKPIKAMAACVNSDLNKTVLQNKLFGSSNWRLKEELGSGMIPKDFINQKSAVTSRGDDVNKINIKHISGGWSELYFRAYEQGRKAAQGVEADVVLIDEQPKDDFFSECVTRTATTQGHIICAFTPLDAKGSDGNLIETLMALPAKEGIDEDKYGPKQRSDGELAMVRATWDDVTHIPESSKKTLAKTYSDLEIEARVYGLPRRGSGQVFPYQEGQITYDAREKDIPEHWPHIIGIDIGHGHGKDPSAAILAAWDEDKDIVYVKLANKEFTNTTDELVKLIMKTDHRCPVAWPSDANRTSINAPTSITEQLREKNVNLVGKPFLNPKGADGKKNNFKMPGIVEINERFAEGRLWIEADCYDLLDEINKYAYLENGKLPDKNDHCIDAFRYTIMSLIQGLGESLNSKGWDDFGDYDEEYHYNTY